jgi:hypothetical protein
VGRWLLLCFVVVGGIGGLKRVLSLPCLLLLLLLLMQSEVDSSYNNATAKDRKDEKGKERKKKF